MSKKVYVIIRQEAKIIHDDEGIHVIGYDLTRIIGVYSTRKKAEKNLAKLRAKTRIPVGAFAIAGNFNYFEYSTWQNVEYTHETKIMYSIKDEIIDPKFEDL